MEAAGLRSLLPPSKKARLSTRAMSLARLDAWTLVAKTSAAEAHLAGALDLRDLALQDIEEIANCKALQVALLAQNLLSQLSSAVFSCRRLRKLDGSRNGLSGLPGAD